VLRVRTESGSVYDVDLQTSQIRRAHGRHGPADTQPQDGIWRRFNGIEGPEVGHPMVVYWAPEIAGATATNLGFRTTVVREVREIEPDPAPGDAPNPGPDPAPDPGPVETPDPAPDPGPEEIPDEPDSTLPDST